MCPLFSLGQNSIGLPEVINYNKNIYQAGLQNWGFKQAKNGILYVANNEGLMSFDGKYWNINPLPNKTIVRSLEMDSEGKIYVGGQDEIGFFTPNIYGKLSYNSLLEKIPTQDRKFEDVWEIIQYKKDIFFRTFSKLFKYSNGSFTVTKAPNLWVFMGTCNGNLYAQDKSNGLFLFENDHWKHIEMPNPFPEGIEITAILKKDNETNIITSLKNGLFELKGNSVIKTNNEISNTLQQKRIYAAINLPDNKLAFATSFGGIIITDINGQPVQEFTKQEGLINNNTLSIFLDNQSNIWVGADNGIACIAYNNAIKHISPNKDDASGYATLIKNNVLYTGSSVGLFALPLSNNSDLSFSRGKFELVTNTNGQTWGISEIKEEILLAHHEGAFIVKNNVASAIKGNTEGFWNFTASDNAFPSTNIVAGNYNGVSFLNQENNTASLVASFPNFKESSRFVVIDDDKNIWVSHPYHGVYKLYLNNYSYAYKTYTNQNGLPSLLNNHIYKIKNEIVVGTEKGIYTYNKTKDIFEPSISYKKILGDQSIRYLKEDKEGNIWFVHEKNVGVIDNAATEPNVIYIPELNNKILSGFENIYPYNSNNIFVGSEKGFLHINFEKFKSNNNITKAIIRKVTIANTIDSTIFNGNYIGGDDLQKKEQIFSIPKKWKLIHFEFSSPNFGQQMNTEFSHRLKGFENNWTEWSTKTEKEYTNLPAGEYTFELKTRNNQQKESEITIYKFKVLPAWYFSTLALIFYFLLFGTGLYFYLNWQRKKALNQQIKYEEEQKKQQYLHQLELEKTENELVALRNEKLNTEIDFKNAELATSAMHLVQKGELLTKIKTNLSQLTKGLENEKAVSEIKKIIKVLGEDDKMDDDWEHFAQHFDKVHSDFVTTLKEKHPTITPNEIKLSAYLRMNLSTKEIAQLMNISVRGIEISRYRLRKKIELPTEVSLFEYFMKMGK
jgi:ligand-binding sensor domain-containing protein/DNA-binding CsgD family transcriptional regulator